MRGERRLVKMDRQVGRTRWKIRVGKYYKKVWCCFGNREREKGRERERSGTREGWRRSGARLALMTGAPRATQVQLSPLPTSAMSDWHNKTQCASVCSQEQLGLWVKREQKWERRMPHLSISPSAL